MPRWNLDYAKGLLSDEDKDTLAYKITQLYVKHNIPSFMINVLFQEHESRGYYAGAKSPAPAVFFTISHAARKLQDAEESATFHMAVNDLVRPIFEKKGLKWEYNIYQHSSDNWRINGMMPPEMKTPEWQRWVDQDKPSPYGSYVNETQS